MEQKIVEFSVEMPEKNGIINTTSGNKYVTLSIINAIEAFNKECPKAGGILNRDHIGHPTEMTHITHSLKYEDNKLIARIELLIEGLENATIKPIISTPLRFGSGVEIERVLGIVNIFLED